MLAILLPFLACLLVVCLLLALPGAPAWAQSGRPIRRSSRSAGGSADILARILGKQIGQANGPAIVVENRPGAGASIAYEFTARAAPDGTTVVVAANSVVINPLLRKTKTITT